MEDTTDSRLLSTFEKGPEFLNYLNTFLEVDVSSETTMTPLEDEAFKQLCAILDEYQEQSYLLDPWLDQIVAPPVEVLRHHALKVAASGTVEHTNKRLDRLSQFIYQLIKTRGHKTIVSFFPHQVSDLTVALTYMNQLDDDTSTRIWTLRYLILLWLSLICRIPFDLTKFDEDDSTPNETALTIERIGRNLLNRSGLEREGASLLLARLYTRTDTGFMFSEFLTWCRPLMSNSIELFRVIGAFQVLAEVLNSASTDQLEPHLLEILEISQLALANTNVSTNMLVRKMALKVSSRVALKWLPAPRSSLQKARALYTSEKENAPEAIDLSDDIEIPGEVEGVINDLLNGIQDRDGTIRWTSAKAIARLGDRLPADFSGQLLETLFALFDVHGTEEDVGLSASAEVTWHGASLACAEFARLGLIEHDHLPALISWMLKALHFDVRKGSHSVGSNVRDAACYVFWSLARNHDADQMKQHATDIAKALLTISLFDREINIRRAANAAFQENVGRMGLFPHGIEVLPIADFFSIGIRRNSFLVVAPKIARFEIYRNELLEHLLNVTLRHWDLLMRDVGSQSLRMICNTDLLSLGPSIVGRLASSLTSVDSNEIHGALLGLSQIAYAFTELGTIGSDHNLTIFKYLNDVPSSTLQSYRNDIILEAACFLLLNSLSTEAIQLFPDNDGESPRWRTVLDLGLRHRDPKVQDSAAKAFQKLSSITNCEKDVKRFIAEMKTTNLILQQGMALVLGHVGSQTYPQGINEALECLLGVVNRSAPESFSPFVEVRRNAYRSIAQLIYTLGNQLSLGINPIKMREIFDSFLAGLDDYTIDERGDVGSWVRISCINGLGSIVELLVKSGLQNDWLPLDTYHNIWASLLKQGAERLDNVRVEVGAQIKDLLAINSSTLSPDGASLLQKLFGTQNEFGEKWNDPNWLFPRMVEVLSISRYRKRVLQGLVLSIGSRNESTQQPASKSLIEELQNGVWSDRDQSATSLIFSDLIIITRENRTSNAMVLPLLATFDAIIEGGLANDLAQSPIGRQMLMELADIVSQKVDRLKSVQRILASMKILVQLLGITETALLAREKIGDFLGHRFPKVREETAEYLYLFLQTQVIEGGDEAESTLLETDWTADEFSAQVDKVKAALSGSTMEL